MMNDALLRFGQGDVAADYVRWCAPHQFADGKVPCCVDARQRPGAGKRQPG